MQSRVVAAVVAASLLAMIGGGVTLKLSTSPAHAACSSGSGVAASGAGDGPIHLGGRSHRHFDFGNWRGHNPQVIHAAYLARFSHPFGSRDKQGSLTEHFVLLPTGFKQGRFLAR
jgi:hypothetical protein